ncbi:MAG: INTEGRAL MEMBRANE PROTEIN (Rhomboid family), partial [uncultured Microvirga sp.]
GGSRSGARRPGPFPVRGSGFRSADHLRARAGTVDRGLGSVSGRGGPGGGGARVFGWRGARARGARAFPDRGRRLKTLDLPELRPLARVLGSRPSQRSVARGLRHAGRAPLRRCALRAAWRGSNRGRRDRAPAGASARGGAACGSFRRRVRADGGGDALCLRAARPGPRGRRRSRDQANAKPRRIIAQPQRRSVPGGLVWDQPAVRLARGAARRDRCQHRLGGPYRGLSGRPPAVSADRGPARDVSAAAWRLVRM